MKVVTKVLEGKHKPILLDYVFKQDGKPKTPIVLVHGYKGFKDWGAFNLVSEYFAERGFFFLKFNFSHNGCSIDKPMDFVDLEAFGNNNFTKELDDLEKVIEFLSKDKSIQDEINIDELSLIGHSRGGGVSILKAAENKLVKRIITWASISNIKSRFPEGEVLEEWRSDGVVFIENTRTNQQLPHYFQIYTDYIENKERLDIKKACLNFKIPHLVLHGVEDETVGMSEADSLGSWSPKSKLLKVEGADHTFGISHPWESKEMSPSLKDVCKFSLDFMNNNFD